MNLRKLRLTQDQQMQLHWLAYQNYMNQNALYEQKKQDDLQKYAQEEMQKRQLTVPKNDKDAASRAITNSKKQKDNGIDTSGWKGVSLNVNIPDWGDYMDENQKQWFGIINPKTGKINNYFETQRTIDSRRKSIAQQGGPKTDEERAYYTQTDPEYQMALANMYIPDGKRSTKKLTEAIGKGITVSPVGIATAMMAGAVANEQAKQDGIKGWLLDVASTFAIHKNEAEVSTRLSDNVMLGEKLQYAQAAKIYADNFKKYMQLSDEYALLQWDNNNRNSSVNSRKTAILEEMGKLLQWNNLLRKTIQDGSTYEYNIDREFNHRRDEDDLGFIGAAYRAQYNPNERVRTRNLSDTMRALLDVTKNTTFIPGKGVDLNTRARLEALSKELDDRFVDFDAYANNKIEWGDRKAREEMQEIADWKAWHTPSAEFLAKEKASLDNYLTSFDTYKYGIWGTLGSSMSFGATLMLSTGLDYLGMGLMYVPHPAAKAAGVVATAAGAAVGIKSGDYENRAEVTENYINRFTNMLDREDKLEKFLEQGREQLAKKGISAKDDQDVFRHFLLKDFVTDDPVIKELALRCMFGANNVYQNDMMAVSADVALNAGLNLFGPTGTIAQEMKIVPTSKFARLRKFVKWADDLPAGSNFVKNVARAGGGAGQLIASALSPLAAPVYKVTAGAMRPVTGTISNAIKPYVKLAGKYMTTSLELSKIMPTKLFKVGTAGKHVFDFAGKSITRGFSEAIEEGKQYEYGLKFQNGEFEGASNTIFQTLIDDLSTGTYAGLAFLGSQFLGLEKDRELLQNMRGGFLGGILNHGQVISMVHSTTGAIREMKAGDAIYQMVLAQKLQDRNELVNGQEFAKYTSAAGRHAMEDAFDRAQAIHDSITNDPTNERYGLSKEELNKQREAYYRIYNYANSKSVIEAAKRRGIKPGTKKFRAFVSLLSHIDNKLKQNIDEYNDDVKTATSIIQNDGLTLEHFEDIEKYLGSEELSDEEKQFLEQIASEYSVLELTEEESATLPRFNSNREANRKKSKLTVAKAYRKIIANRAKSVISNIREMDKAVAKATAIKNLIHELEERSEFLTSAEKTYLSAYKQQYADFIKSLHPIVAEAADIASEDTTDARESTNPEVFDKLSSIYRTLALREALIQEAEQLRYDLVGENEVSMFEDASQNDLFVNDQLAAINKRLNRVKRAKRGVTKEDVVSYSATGRTDAVISRYEEALKDDLLLMEDIMTDFREFRERKLRNTNSLEYEQQQLAEQQGLAWELAKQTGNRNLLQLERYSKVAEEKMRQTSDYSQAMPWNQRKLTLPKPISRTPDEFTEQEMDDIINQIESEYAPGIIIPVPYRDQGNLRTGDKYHSKNTGDKKTYVVVDIKQQALGESGVSVDDTYVGIQHSRSKGNVKYVPLTQFYLDFEQGSYVPTETEWHNGDKKQGLVVGELYDIYTAFSTDKVKVVGFEKQNVIVENSAGETIVYTIKLLKNAIKSYKENPLLQSTDQEFLDYILDFEFLTGQHVTGNINDTNTQMGRLYHLYDIQRLIRKNLDQEATTDTSYVSTRGDVYNRVNSLVGHPYERNESQRQIEHVVTTLFAAATTKEEYNTLVKQLQDYYNGELDESDESNKQLLKMLPKLTHWNPALKLHAKRLDLSRYIASPNRFDNEIIHLLQQEDWAAHGVASRIIRDIAVNTLLYGETVTDYDIQDGSGKHSVLDIMTTDLLDKFTGELLQLRNRLIAQGKIIFKLESPILNGSIATDVDLATIDQFGNVQLIDIASSKHNLNENGRWDKIVKGEDDAPVFDERYISTSRIQGGVRYTPRLETRKQTYDKLATPIIDEMRALFGSNFAGLYVFPIQMQVEWDGSLLQDLKEITDLNVGTQILLEKNDQFGQYLKEVLQKDSEELREYLNQTGGLVQTIQQLKLSMQNLEQLSGTAQTAYEMFELFVNDVIKPAYDNVTDIDELLDGKISATRFYINSISNTAKHVLFSILTAVNRINQEQSAADNIVALNQANLEVMSSIQRRTESVKRYINAVNNGEFTRPGGLMLKSVLDYLLSFRNDVKGMSAELRKIGSQESMKMIDDIYRIHDEIVDVYGRYPGAYVDRQINDDQQILHNAPILPKNHPLNALLNQPDFVTNGSCQLIYGIIENGQVKPLYQLSNQKGAGVYAIFSYGGTKYLPVQVQPSYYKSSGNFTETGKLFINDVLQAQIESQTDGQVVYGQYQRMLPTVHFNAAPHNVAVDKTLRLSEQEVRELDGNSNKIGFVNKNNQLVTLSTTNSTIIDTGVSGVSGGIYYLMEFPFDEYTNGGLSAFPYYPIRLMSKKLAKDDIDVIIDILQKNVNSISNTGRSILNMSYQKDDVEYPFTNRLVLLFYVKLGNSASVENKSSIFVDNLGQVFISGEKLNVENEYDKLNFIKFLTGYEINSNRSILSAKLTDNTSEVFGKLKNWIDLNGALTISSSLMFDQQDVDEKGFYGVGWSLRHGRLLTNLSSVNTPSIRIIAPDKGQALPEVQPQPLEPFDPQNIITSLEDFDVYNQGIDALASTDEAKNYELQVDREHAQKIFDRILGESVPTKIVDNIIKVLNSGAKVVGMCSEDAVVLSTKAKRGVEYHEAFHRIFELVIDQKDKEKYRLIFIRKNPYIDSTSNRSIAEAMADSFMDFANALSEIKSASIRELFSKIKQFIDVIRKIGSVRLTYLYFAINFGRYKNKAVSSENLLEFRDKYTIPFEAAVLYHSVYNPYNHLEVELPNIPTYTAYKDAIDTIASNIISANGVKMFGEGVRSIKLELEDILKLYDGKFYERYVGTGEHLNKTQKVFKDIFDNWDHVLPDIAAQFTKHGLPVRVRKGKLIEVSESDLARETQDRDDQRIESEGSTSPDVGQWTKEPYEMPRHVSIKNGARFFFSTIPAMRWVKPGETDVQGNPIPEFVLTKTSAGDYIDQQNRLVSRKDDGTFVIKHTDTLVDPRTLKTHRNVLYDTNSLGYNFYVPFRDMFNSVADRCYDVKTPQELKNRFAQLAAEDAKYIYLYKKYAEALESLNYRDNHGLYVSDDGKTRYVKRVVDGRNMYVKATYVKKFDLVETEGDPIEEDKIRLRKNYNYQSIVVSVFNAVSSHKMNVKMIRSTHEGINSYTYQITNTDMGYTARGYSRLWHTQFMSDQDVIQKEDNGDRIIYKANKKYFDNIADEFESIYEQITSRRATGTITTKGGRQFNALQQPQELKRYIVELYNKLGVTIDDVIFDEVLKRIGAGKSDYRALVTYFKQHGEDFGVTKGVSIPFFIRSIRNIVGETGVVLPMFVSGAFYTGSGVIGQLADAKYQYTTKYDTTMINMPGGTRCYTITNDNPLTRFTKMLNAPNSKMRKDLMQSAYCKGSMWLNHLELGGCRIEFYNHAGYRSDVTTDIGADYMLVNSAEDFVNKITYLMNDCIVPPTMSNKKTYGVFQLLDNTTGQARKLPGIHYRENPRDKLTNEGTSNKYAVDETTIPILYDSTYNGELLTKQERNSNRYFVLPDQIYSTFMWYFKSERDAVEQNIERNKTIPDNERVINYDTAENGSKYPGGTHFARLYGVYVVKEDGSEDFINFNDNNRTPEQNLALADEVFFNASEIEQKAIITRILMKEFNKTLDKVIELGLVERTSQQQSMFNLKNIALDKNLIGAIVTGIAPVYSILRNPDGSPKIAKNPDGTPKLTKLGRPTYLHRSPEQINSLAVAMFVMDITIKHIVSNEEFQRMYVGNPTEFKIFYDKNSRVVNDTDDLSKRLGGHASTGENNCPTDDTPNEYVCAELNDYKVGSPIHTDLVKWFYESTARYTLFAESKKQIDILFENLKPAVKNFAQSVFEDAQFSGGSSLTASTFISDRIGDLKNGLEQDLSDDIDNAILKAFFSSFVEGRPNRSAFTKLVEKDLSELLYKWTIRYENEEYRKQSLIADIDKINEKLRDKHLLEGVEAHAKDYASSFAEGKVNVADGASYVSPRMVKWMLLKIGLFTGKVAKAYNLLESDSKQNPLDVAEAYHIIHEAMFGTQKYTATGYRMNNGQPIFYYNKTALFPLFKQNSFGLMFDLYNKMKEQDVHMVMMTSAVKFGSLGAQSLPTTKEDMQAFKFNTYVQAFDFLTKQLNTDPSESDTMKMGSQATKVVMAAVDKAKHDYVLNNNTSFSTFGRNTISGNEISTTIFSSMKKIAEMRGAEFEEQISTDGVKDDQKLSDYILRQLSDRDADDNMLRGLRLDKGKMHSLSASSNMNWLQSIVASNVNKAVIDINLPGSAFIQRSVFGLNGGSVLYDDENRRLNGGDKLLMKNADGSMDAVISIDYFYQLFPELEKMSFTDARQWLIDNQIVGKNAKTLTMGYRIPTQAVSSIHALKFVDVIAATRDTIILPEEFTAITGSDFDIDKLFLSTKWLGVVDDNITDTFDSKDPRSQENLLLDMYLQVLMQPSNKYAMILSRSIDKDTDVAKRIADKTTPPNNEPVGIMSASGIVKQTEIKEENKSGSEGIATFALNNNSLIITSQFKVGFPQRGIVRALGITRLYDDLDAEGNTVMSGIGAGINGNVDIAKDPWPSKLNFGSYVNDMVTLLIRAGAGEQAFYFTKQPVIRELQILDEKSKGYLFNPDGIGQYILQKILTSRFERSTFLNTGHGINDSLLDVFNAVKNPVTRYYDMNQPDVVFDTHNNVVAKQTYKNTVLRNVFEIIQQIFGVDQENPNNKIKQHVDIVGNTQPWTILEDVATYHNKRSDIYNTEKRYVVYITQYDDKGVLMPKRKLELSTNDVQMFVYLTAKLLEPYVHSMKELVQYSKIDTKKQGKTLSEQLVFLHNYKRIFEDGNSLFDKYDLQRMALSSYIGLKTRLAISITRNVFDGYSIEGSSSMMNWIDEFNINCGIPYKKESVEGLTKAITQYIKYNFIKKYAKDNKIDMKGLFVGDDAIYNRLGRLTRMILANRRFYKDYIDENGKISNVLLQSLRECYIPEYNYHKDVPKFVEIKNKKEESSSDKNPITYAWEQILNDEQHPEIQLFAKDLVVYAFVNSGDYNDHGGFFSYVPWSWRINSGYVDYIDDITDQASSMLELDASSINYYITPTHEDTLLLVQLDILKGSWYDENIVPTIRKSEKDSFGVRADNFVEYIGKDGNPYMIAAVLNQVDLNTGARKIIAPSRFGKNKVVKVKKDNSYGNSLEDYYIYEYYRDGSALDSNGNIIKFPIYILSSARGGMFYGHKMLQYQEDMGFSWEKTSQYSFSHVSDFFEDAAAQLQQISNAILKSRQQDIKENMVSREDVIVESFKALFNAGVVYTTDETQFIYDKNDPFTLISQYIAANATIIGENISPTGVLSRLKQDPNEEKKSDEIGKYDVDKRSPLSNLAKREFTITEDSSAAINAPVGFDVINAMTMRLPENAKLQSVEQALLMIKLLALRNHLRTNLDRVDNKKQYNRTIQEIANNIEDLATNSTAGVNARSVGRRKYIDVNGLVTEFFNNVWPSQVMEVERQLMRSSFLTNKEAALTLVRTGNIEFIHTVGRDGHQVTVPETLAQTRTYLKEHPEIYKTKKETVPDINPQDVKSTVQSMQDGKNFPESEKKSVKEVLGIDHMPKVVMASEHTDPVFHMKKVKEMVEAELKKPSKDRNFHMLQIMTKHDGLPLRELLELKIPKSVHFSITSLGNTKWEPGVMKMDDLLDRIQEFINDGVLNPALVTVRIDPIIPGVTKKEDVEHIMSRAKDMGIKLFKFSVMDSYGYTQEGVRSTNKRDRFIIQRMEELGYNWDTYYGRMQDGAVNFDAKPEIISEIYKFMDDLAEKYNVFINTCGEKPRNIPNLKRIKTQTGCLNVETINNVLGTNDVQQVKNMQRPGSCTCFGNKIDALRYDDACASSCAYCYAYHNSNAAMKYYNEDGTLKDSYMTRTRRYENNIGLFVKQYSGNWSREEVENDPKTLYVFTDNTDRDSGSGEITANSWYSKKYGEGHHYPTSTAAVIRGLNNARPISTMHYFYKTHGFTHPVRDRNSKALWNDSDVEEFKTVIEDEIKEIVREFNTGNYDTIMFPSGDGLFNTNISNITKDRCPEIYKALVDILRKYGFDSLIPFEDKISDKTEAFGVEVHDVLHLSYYERMSIMSHWLSNNVGIVAYRKKGNDPESYSVASVKAGWIGNPFSVNERGPITVQRFYEWLTTGNNFGNSMATEQFRQAVVQKILDSDENTPIWYYTELNRPSHATIIGYLIRHKDLLKNNPQVYDNSLSSDYVMTSGGAEGSDATWGWFAQQYGIPVEPSRQMHFYTGERSKGNAPYGNVEVNTEDYEEGRYKAAQAAQYNYGYGLTTMKDPRLIRNWCQVKYADAVFAVGHIVKPGDRLFPNIEGDVRVARNYAVQGGTGYAVAMAILSGKPVYVYDQIAKVWCKCVNGQWNRLSYTPTLTRRFAGIGTRQINQNGIQAIKDVFEETIKRDNEQSALNSLTSAFESDRRNNGGNIMYHINPKKKPGLMDAVRKKNPFIVEKELKEAFDFLESLPNTQNDNAYVSTCIKWLKNGSITLPRDNEKVRSIFDTARKKHKDITKYETPFNLMLDLIGSEYKRQPAPKDMSKYTKLTKAYSQIVVDENGVENTVDVYDVENSEAGQLDVVQLIADTAYKNKEGDLLNDFLIWCLATYNYNKSTGKATPTTSAKNYWNNYQSGKHQIALLNNYPIAFNATDKGPIDLWWDFSDHSHNTLKEVPLNIRDNIYKGWAAKTDVGRQDLGNYHYFPLTPGRYMYDNDVSYVINLPGDGASQLRIQSDTNSSFTKININIGSIAFTIQEGDHVILLEAYYKGKSLYNLYSDSETDKIKELNRRLDDLYYSDSIFTGYTFNILAIIDIVASIKLIFSDKILNGGSLRNLSQNTTPIKKPNIPDTQLSQDVLQAVIDNYVLNIEDEYEDATPHPPIRPRNNEYSAHEYEVSDEEVVEIAKDVLKQDDLSKDYEKYLNSPINEELKKALHAILKKYHFDIIEDDLSAVFGEDTLGAFDFIEKIVYLSKNRKDAITDAEEFSHAFIKMLGSSYHRLLTRESNPEVYRLYSELRDLIVNTYFYKLIYELYKDVYQFPNGSPNVPMIIEEALGKALAVVLNRRAEARQFKADRTFWLKLKSMWNKFLDWFTGATEAQIKEIDPKSKQFARAGIYDSTLEFELNRIADSILDGDYHRKYLRKDTMKGKKKLNYNQTIENDIKKTGGKSLEIMRTFTELGGIITGSLSYRKLGSVYRSSIDSLHDIDVIFDYDTHHMLNTLPITGVNADRYVYSSERILATMEVIPQTKRMLEQIKSKYPGFDVVCAFPSGRKFIINGIICDNEELRNRFINMEGNFNKRLHSLTLEERDLIWLVDMFMNPKNTDSKDIILDTTYGLPLARYNLSFEEKLKFGRAKDLFDYQVWDTTDRRNVLQSAAHGGVMYNKKETKQDLMLFDPEQLRRDGIERKKQCK